LAVAFLAGKPHNRLLQSEDGRFQGLSMQAQTERVQLMLVERLVYHATEVPRPCGDVPQMRPAGSSRMGFGRFPGARLTEGVR
jgi:hypothetical protein